MRDLGTPGELRDAILASSCVPPFMPLVTVGGKAGFDGGLVDNVPVVCSAGIAAGIDMSLHVVARLLGREVAESTARQMEYPWQPTV